jgi:hypothetical protein
MTAAVATDEQAYRIALYNAAMIYVSQGVPLIPLGQIYYDAAGKKPHGVPALVRWSDPKNLITRPEQVEKWFGLAGQAQGLAIATGTLFMLDSDRRGGDEAQPPEGAWVERHSGRGGWHAYMLNTSGARNTAGAVAAGIDTRGVGGLSVAAPTRSIHADGSVTQWITERPLSEFRPAELAPAPEYGLRVAAPRPALVHGATEMTQERAVAAVREHRDAYLATAKGGRHHALMAYLGVLSRFEMSSGTPVSDMHATLEAAALLHPDSVAGEVFESVEKAVAQAVNYAMASPWVIVEETGFEARFALDPTEPAAGSPSAGGDYALRDDEDDPDVFTDADFDGSVELPEPAYGGFGGAAKLLYPDKAHWFQGESGSGKSWVALAVVVEVVRDGHRAWIIDYENSRGEFAGRLKALGITREEMRLVTYTSGADMMYAELRGRMADRAERYGLVVIDGVSSALTAAGKSGNDAQEFGAWFDQIPRKARMSISIDHVVKSLDDRRGMAVGTQAKKGRTDVAFEIRASKPFSRGRAGTIDMVLRKDRHGGLPMALDSVMRLSVTSSPDGREVSLSVHTESTGEFLADPHAALFSALYANGVTASVSAEEFGKAVRETGAGIRNNQRAEMRDAYRGYWAEREDEKEAVQPVDNPVDNSVP